MVQNRESALHQKVGEAHTSRKGLLEREKQANDDREEGCTFDESCQNDGVALDVSGSFRLTCDGFTGFAADHADADAGTNHGEASADCSDSVVVRGLGDLNSLLKHICSHRWLL